MTKKTSKRPSPIELDNGFRIRAVRGPRNGDEWYFKLFRHEYGKDHIYKCFWATRFQAQVIGIEFINAGETKNLKKGDFERLVEEWLSSSDFAVSYRPKTQAQYRTNSKHLLRFFQKYPDHTQVSNMISSLLAEGKGFRTIKGIITCGGALHKWAKKKNKLTGASPFRDHDLPDKAKKKKIHPTDQDIDLLIEGLTGWHKLAAIVLTYTGMRVGEIGLLKWKDIDFERNRIYIDGKGEKERIIPIPPPIMETLKEYRGEDDSYVCGVKNVASPEFYTALKETCEDLKLPHITPHALRRATANRFRKAGIPPQQTAKYLGNSPKVLIAFYEEVAAEELETASQAVYGK